MLCENFDDILGDKKQLPAVPPAPPRPPPPPPRCQVAWLDIKLYVMSEETQACKTTKVLEDAEFNYFPIDIDHSKVDRRADVKLNAVFLVL